MKCCDARPFFDRMYREGDAFDRSDVADHVTTCEKCGHEYAQWCRIADTFADTPHLDAPPDLYRTVMQAITVHNTPRLKWSLRPFLQWYPVPATALIAVMFLAVGTMLFLRQQPTGSQQIISEMKAPTEQGQNFVTAHFEIACATARSVALVGDFNGWNTARNPLVKNSDGTWTIDLAIPSGCYQYLFCIDGTTWRTDPQRPEKIPDGFGGFNTVIEL